MPNPRSLWPLLPIAIVLTSTAISLPCLPVATPFLLLGSLASAIPAIVRAWRAARGTALRPAIVWAIAAIGLATLAAMVAMAEPASTGRPGSGQVVYFSTLAAFAALLSVLNARTPGGGAWAILMAMLVVVFLVPWLEGSGLVREGGGWDRLRLTAPWTIFYWLLVIAGVTNYLPTKYGPAAAWLGLGFLAEYLGLTRTDWDHPGRGMLWMAVPLCWAMSAWSADVVSRRATKSESDLGRLWAWFRDAWGVVWALRVMERFNRAAESAGWPIRLAWHGVVPAPGVDPDRAEVPPDAWLTLAGLLRRFAPPDRLREVIDEGRPALVAPLVGPGGLV